MTGRPTVTRHAPGKLFVAGEYAVREPGHPAIVVAVDRHVSVTVSGAAGADVVIESDLRPGRAELRRGGDGLEAYDGRPVEGLDPVLAAVAVVDELLTGRGVRPSPMRVSITSRLHHEGTKLGLGSSGAVTVATVAAVAAHHGVELSPDMHFRLAMLATARQDPGASGGDLAASVWGGWIAYRAPDRQAVLDLARRRGIPAMLRAPWPGFAVRPLPPPRGVSLEVGWTGQPASTASMSGRLDAGRWRGSVAHRSFLACSDERVQASIHALETGDGPRLLHEIRSIRRLLAELDDQVRLGIFTGRLTALCDAAEAVGGAAKPSGAGAGDCGIALLDAAAMPEIAQLREKWAAAGVVPVPIRVQPPHGGAE